MLVSCGSDRNDATNAASLVFNGGNLRNAIPREAYAIFGVPARFKEEFVKRYNLFAADLEANGWDRRLFDRADGWWT